LAGVATPPSATVAAALLFAGACAGILYRHSRFGLELRDFRDGIYYAVVALLRGDNPYDAVHYLATYPVEQAYSPYAPGFLTLHLPFALLPFEAAQVAYFISLCGLALLLAHVAWTNASGHVSMAASLVLATMLVLSRPGSWGLGLGQFALQFGIGTALALCLARRRPWLAACGCAVTLLKPTYGVPLSLLLLSIGQTRVWLLGVAIAALLSLLPGLAVLRAAGGSAALLESVRTSFASFANDPTASAASGPERIDIVGLAGYALSRNPPAALEALLTLSILLVGVWSFRRLVLDAGGSVAPLALVIACLTLLLCTYHQTYDLPLILVPLTAWVLATEPNPLTLFPTGVSTNTARLNDFWLPPLEKGDRGGFSEQSTPQIPPDLPFSKGGTCPRSENRQSPTRDGGTQRSAVRFPSPRRRGARGEVSSPSPTQTRFETRTAPTLLVRWTVPALLLFPMVNYLSPQAIQDRLGIEGWIGAGLTRVNAMALLLAFGVSCLAATPGLANGRLRRLA
jgi:hypothetical protein